MKFRLKEVQGASEGRRPIKKSRELWSLNEVQEAGEGRRPIKKSRQPWKQDIHTTRERKTNRRREDKINATK